MTALLMGRMSGYVDGGHPQLGVLGHPPRDAAEEFGQRAALGTPDSENEQLEAPMRAEWRTEACRAEYSA